MLHGVSLVHVNNDDIQTAIKNNAHPDIIAKLKGQVAFGCVTGFEYHEVPFKDLRNLLSNDVGFNNFKFKKAEDAIYDKQKHPNAQGRIRGLANIEGGCSWLWIDVDDTLVEAKKMHNILNNINHHLALTSNRNNKYKYRIIVELDRKLTITREEWKPFMQAISRYLGVGKIDKLAMSQVAFGYKSRTVLSVLHGEKVNPTNALLKAKAEVAKKAEEDAVTYNISSKEAQRALDNPFSTFEFAYTAQVGDRWSTSMAAISKAKKLGASKEYIKELMYKINKFLDVPKSRELVEKSLFSAI